MMIDDIINDNRICPMCRKETDYMSMVWLDGLCTCPSCYEARKKDEELIMKKGA